MMEAPSQGHHSWSPLAWFVPIIVLGASDVWLMPLVASKDVPDSERGSVRGAHPVPTSVWECPALIWKVWIL